MAERLRLLDFRKPRLRRMPDEKAQRLPPLFTVNNGSKVCLTDDSSGERGTFTRMNVQKFLSPCGEKNG